MRRYHKPALTHPTRKSVNKISVPPAKLEGKFLAKCQAPFRPIFRNNLQPDSALPTHHFVRLRLDDGHHDLRSKIIGRRPADARAELSQQYHIFNEQQHEPRGLRYLLPTNLLSTSNHLPAARHRIWFVHYSASPNTAHPVAGVCRVMHTPATSR